MVYDVKTTICKSACNSLKLYLYFLTDIHRVDGIVTFGVLFTLLYAGKQLNEICITFNIFMADGHIYFLLDYDRPIGSNSAYYFLCIYPFQVYKR